jgi:hypothetical protein
MPSPFPGMDPYLEHPAIWPGVHANLIVSIQDALQPLVRPRYYVSVELRVRELDPDESALAGIPDATVIEAADQRGPSRPANGPASAAGVRARGRTNGSGPNARVLTVAMPRTIPVRERYLEVRDTETRDAVTVIEVLSPTNKASGRGRAEYEGKRLAIAATLTNFVEIDLLRIGEPMPVRYLVDPPPDDQLGAYRVLVSRGHWEHRAELYPVSLRERLPTVPIPLRPGDPEPPLDLQSVIDTVYDRGAYDLHLNYRRDPVPSLGPADAAWAAALLEQSRRR